MKKSKSEGILSCLFPSERQKSGPFLNKHWLAVGDPGVDVLLHNLERGCI